MHYSKNEWYVACTESELPDDAPLPATILNERLVLWRAGDAIVAMEDRCIHRAAPLSLGRCEASTLRCMYHGLLFDGSGKVVEIPGQDVIPPNARVKKTYPVETRFGWVWVWMGDPAAADRALLPELPAGIAMADFVTGSDVLEYQAEAGLISDNLLDFSHLTYVHANSFQASDDWADSTMTTVPLDRGIRFQRWIEDTTGPGYLQLTERCDEWLGYDYLIPGILLMMSGMFPKGTARGCDHQRPDFTKAIAAVALNIQAVTPQRPKAARYYFLTGPDRRFGDEAVLGGMMTLTRRAFEEDKVMIEAQQRVLDETPDRAIMATVHDRGVTLYNRLVKRRVAEEQPGVVVVPEAIEA